MGKRARGPEESYNGSGKRRSQKKKGALRLTPNPAGFKQNRAGHEGSESKEETRLRLRVKQLDKAATKAYDKGRNPKGYLAAKKELGAVCREAGMVEKCCAAYEECLKLDLQDSANVRGVVVSCYMDLGYAEKARALMDKYPDDKSTQFLFSKALIEYISWKLLEEAGSSEDLAAACMKAALKANEHVGVFLTYAETFLEVCKDIQTIHGARQGTVEDAFAYCAWDFSLWLDTEGAREWVVESMQGQEVGVPDPEMVDLLSTNPKEPKYFDMYCQAMRVIARKAEQGDEDEENDDNDDDDGGGGGSDDDDDDNDDDEESGEAGSEDEGEEGMFSEEGKADRPWH